MNEVEIFLHSPDASEGINIYIEIQDGCFYLRKNKYLVSETIFSLLKDLCMHDKDKCPFSFETLIWWNGLFQGLVANNISIGVKRKNVSIYQKIDILI